MNNLDIIDRARGGPFVVRAHGFTFTVKDPADMSYMHVLLCLMNGYPPSPPFDLTGWEVSLVGGAWAAHYDLPDIDDARRLVYVTDRYRSAIVADLQAFHRVDFGELWRARRWRTALDLIDHLPAHSWYASSVQGDEEHTKMLAESMAAREGEGEKSGPPQHSWTPEVAAITSLHNSVRYQTYAILAAAGDKKAKPPESMPTPSSPLEAMLKRIEYENRKTAHEALVARMLPHKRRT
jgi:hypothetical protein